MEKELEILQQIQENEYVTQRDLAKSTGLSLGGVNLLIKNMVKKGFIMIERLNSQNIRYILTPTGIAEKTAKTYNYIVRIYNSMLHMQTAIQTILDRQLECGVDKVYLYGQEDEVYQLIKVVLDKAVEEKNIKYRKIDHLDEYNKRSDAFLLVWDNTIEMILNSKDLNIINILKYI